MNRPEELVGMDVSPYNREKEKERAEKAIMYHIAHGLDIHKSRSSEKVLLACNADETGIHVG